MQRSLIFSFLVYFGFCFSLSRGLADDEVTSNSSILPIIVQVESPRIVNYQNSSLFDSPAGALQYEPLVDLQSRNSPDAQGDLAIRGGIFENSGIQIGASSFFDSQTGHYLLEVPIPQRMLSVPGVFTGLDNSLLGLNAAVGSVQYSWQPIGETTADTFVGLGTHETNTERVYLSKSNLWELGEHSFNADFEFSHSDSNGTIEGGQDNFNRVAGRFQIIGPRSQTDLFAGYQEKSYSWPDLYAPSQIHELVGASQIEAEHLKTPLFLLNHRQEYGGKSYFEVGQFYRRNTDDYDFDRYNPELFNPYRHTTEFWSGAFSGKHVDEKWQWRYAMQYAGDHIKSTSLNYAGFHSRSYGHFALVPGRSFDLSADLSLLVEAGSTYNDTNREGGRFGPVGGVTFRREKTKGELEVLYGQVSQSSQVPGYTAVGSNPSAGLFRGNSSLGKTVSTNYEFGIKTDRKSIKSNSALFYRYDHDLVDWTYREELSPGAARSANNLNVGTFGVESNVQKELDLLTLIVGYTFLLKNPNDFPEGADASFYALNYPKHRISSSLVVRPLERLSFGVESEVRHQVPNMLRDSQDLTYFLASASASWRLPAPKDLVLSFTVENLTNEHYEEVPGVPGSGRLLMLSVNLVL